MSNTYSIQDGFELCKANKYHEAIAAFTGVLESNPEAFWPNFWLAYSLAHIGETNRSVEIYTRLCNGKEDVELARIGLIEAYIRGGNLDAAYSNFKTLSKNDVVTRKDELARLARWIARCRLDTAKPYLGLFNLESDLVEYCKFEKFKL